MRSPSITSSHLNAVAPLVKVKRIHSNRSETETIYKVQTVTTSSRVASVVPSPKGSFPNSGFRGLKVFSDRKSSSKENYSPPRIINGSPKRNSPPGGYVTIEPLYAEPKKETPTNIISSSSNLQPKTKEERLEEQRQRREQRKRETQTTTPGIRVGRPSSIFDSLTKRR